MTFKKHHEYNGSYLVVFAIDYTTVQNFMYDLFDTKWAFIRPLDEFIDIYRGGRRGIISISKKHSFGQRSNYDAFEIIEGDSVIRKNKVSAIRRQRNLSRKRHKVRFK